MHIVNVYFNIRSKMEITLQFDLIKLWAWVLDAPVGSPCSVHLQTEMLFQSSFLKHKIIGISVSSLRFLGQLIMRVVYDVKWVSGAAGISFAGVGNSWKFNSNASCKWVGLVVSRMKSCFLLSQTGRDSQHQEIYQLQSVNLSRFANFSCPKNYKDRMLFPSMYQHYHYHILSTCISSVR